MARSGHLLLKNKLVNHPRFVFVVVIYELRGFCTNYFDDAAGIIINRDFYEQYILFLVSSLRK